MYLLDADTLTHLHKGHERVAERLHQCPDPVVGISVVTNLGCAVDDLHIS